MPPEHTTDTSRYLTLHDYLRVLRNRWILIVALGLVCGAAVYAYYKPQKPVYRAQASVAFQDEARGLALVGIPAPSFETSTALASTSSETITRPQILVPVKNSLRVKLSTGQIAGAIHPAVAPNSSLLNISVDAATPTLAAQIANAVAQRAVDLSNQQTRARFAQAARSMSRQLKALTKAVGGSNNRIFYVDQLQRLASLSTFAQNAQVAQFAQPQAVAVAPKPLRSAIYGVALGLLLGVVIAFIVDSLDRRLRTADEIQGYLEAPLLGQIREDSLGRMATFPNGAERAGNVEFETFRILWRNLQFLDVDTPMRSVAVTSALPEEGKSTVAASVAAVAAGTGKRVLLIESDLRRPTLAARLELAPEPGVTEYIVGHAALDEVIQHKTLVEAMSENGGGPASSTANGSSASEVGFDFIAAGGPTPRSPELLGSARFSSFLQDMLQRYELVIFDTSPLLPVADTLVLIPQVDRVLLCVRAGRTTRSEADVTRRTLARLPDKPMGVVVTGITRRDEHDYAVYSYTYAYR